MLSPTSVVLFSKHLTLNCRWCMKLVSQTLSKALQSPLFQPCLHPSLNQERKKPLGNQFIPKPTWLPALFIRAVSLELCKSPRGHACSFLVLLDKSTGVPSVSLEGLMGSSITEMLPFSHSSSCCFALSVAKKNYD